MKLTTVLLLALSGGGVLASGDEALAPRIGVEFVAPEKFADATRDWGGDAERESNLAELRLHLEQRAGRRMSAGQSLAVRITGLDLAGRYEAWHGAPSNPRVVRPAYPPRIDLSFTLTAADGSLLKQGARRLRDPYMIGGLTYRGDRLRYEKGLLDDWLERELPM